MRLRFFSALFFLLFALLALDTHAVPRVATRAVNLSRPTALQKFLNEAREKTDWALAEDGWLPMDLENPLALRVVVPPIGVIDLRLTKVNPVTGLPAGEKSQILLFHGKARVRNRMRGTNACIPRHITIPAAGNVSDGNLELSLAWPGPHTTRYLRVLLPLARGEKIAQVGRAQNVSGFILSGRSCGLADTSPVTAFESAQAAVAVLDNPNAAAATSKRAEIIIDCDYECAAALGGSSKAQTKLISFLSIVNGVYLPQLGLALAPVRYVVRTSTSTYPSNIVDANALLDRLFAVAPSLGVADLKHLITGREIDGNTIGLSYWGTNVSGGVTCREPDYSLGWSQQFNEALTPYIMAHEIGHNLSATHVSDGIMMPALGVPPPTQFSDFSKNQIQAYIGAYGFCFDNPSSSSSSSTSGGAGSSSSTGYGNGGTGDGGNTGPHATLSASYKRMSFRASVSVPAGYSSCSLRLTGGRTRAEIYSRPVQLAVTNIAGSASASFSAIMLGVNPSKNRKPVKAFINAQVQCAEGTLVSSTRGITLTDRSRVVRRGQYKNARSWLKALAGLL